MTLTLILPLSSAVQVRAKERMAALLALYTTVPGNPFTPAIELFRMIDPPSFISGRAFCTVNKVPRTLTLNVSSNPFSVMEPSGLLSSPTPALANRTSIRPFSFLTVSNSRSRCQYLYFFLQSIYHF